MEFKNKDAYEETLLYIEFSKKLPIVLTEKMIKLLDLGLFYPHGRDRCLRPILIFRPKVTIDNVVVLEDAIETTHFVVQYVINHMMCEGKVENFVMIIDSENLSFTQLPKMWIIAFIKTFNHYYYQRNTGIVILNAHWTVSALYAIAKPFLSSTTKEKIIFTSNSSWDELTKKIDPKQLEQKYQGEAQNLTEFWPPRAPWNDYGIYEENLLSNNQVDKNNQNNTHNETETKKEGPSVETENVIIKMQNEIKSKSGNKLESSGSKKRPGKKEWKWIIF